MELFAILLSSVLGVLSPVGLVADEVAEDAIRDRLVAAEQLAVRIDNRPSYRFLQGRVDQIRIAGRGLFPIEGVRIAVLELETDPIALDPTRLRAGQIEAEQPVRAGVRLVLSREDLNRALQAPVIADRLQALSESLLLSSPTQELERFQFVDPQVEFLAGDRIRLQVTLSPRQGDRPASEQTPQTPEQTIVAETGLAIVQGHQLQLVDPQISLNGQPVPPQVVNLLIGGLNDRLDLDKLLDRGSTARILKLEISPEQMTIAGFVSLDAEFVSGIGPTAAVDP